MKHELKDCTFIVPYFRDSQEREENLDCILNFLNENFNSNIILVECRENKIIKKFRWDIYYYHIPMNDGIFHRTKVINDGIRNADTPYISIFDTDCFFEPENILKAVDLLRNGATLTYPYFGNFYDIDRSYILDGVIKKHQSYVKGSYGGACFLNRLDYIKCGLENENLIGAWVHDDVERFARVEKLGYKIERVDGYCYHIEHPPSKDSKSNPYAIANNLEYLKVKNMGKEELQNYISEWQWVK